MADYWQETVSKNKIGNENELIYIKFIDSII